MSNAAAFAQVAAVRAKVVRLASGQAAREARQAVAAEWDRLIDDGFRAEAAPTGQPWAPTQRGGRILQRTGRMRTGWRVLATARGVTITNAVAYAWYHQRGAPARGLPQRAMIPDPSRSLPTRWRVGAERAIARVLKHYLP